MIFYGFNDPPISEKVATPAEHKDEAFAVDPFGTMDLYRIDPYPVGSAASPLEGVNLLTPSPTPESVISTLDLAAAVTSAVSTLEDAL